MAWGQRACARAAVSVKFLFCLTRSVADVSARRLLLQDLFYAYASASEPTVIRDRLGLPIGTIMRLWHFKFTLFPHQYAILFTSQ